MTRRRPRVGWPSVAIASDRWAVAGTIRAAAISSIERPAWTALAEVDRRCRMIAALQTTRASDRTVNTLEARARERANTVRPSHRPSTAIRL